MHFYVCVTLLVPMCSLCVSDQINSKTYATICVKPSVNLASLCINHTENFKVLMFYKCGSIITTKITFSKLTYEIHRYHRISLRNKARNEAWTGGLGRRRETFAKGWGYQGAFLKLVS